MNKCRCLGVALLIVIGAGTAHGLIQAALPLSKILNDSKYVVLAKVAFFDADKKQMILTVTENLLPKKSKPSFKEVAVLMEGDKDAKTHNHMPQLMKRLAKDLPVVLFIEQLPNDVFLTYLYTNGTWIELKGKATADGPGVWDLTHGEPELHKTYRGTTEKLRQLILDNAAGEQRLPDIDKKQKKGFGPELPGK